MNESVKKVQRTICIHFFTLGLVLTGCSSHNPKNSQENKASIPITTVDPLLQKAYTGDPEAQYRIGRIYYEGKGIRYDGKGIPHDYNKAIEYFLKSAKQGYAQAQNDLALIYLNGHGVVENPQEAVSWLSLAAEQNLPEAQYHLSSLYAQGQGVSRNEDVAFDLLLKSAQANFVKAQYNLGIYYIFGRNFSFRAKNLADMIRAIHTVHENVFPNLNEQDIELGFSWLEKAKEQGFHEATEALEQLSILRFIDYETGKFNNNAFLSAQIDEHAREKLSEMFDKELNEDHQKENLFQAGQELK